MKKIIAALLIGVMTFMLASCAPQIKESETSEAGTQATEVTVTEAPEEEIYQGMAGMANPWVDSDREDTFAATGFDLIAPADAVNVAYSYMPGTGMVQLNFNMENAMWVYRVQPTAGLEDISGIYAEWNYTEATQIAGMDAMEYVFASETEGDTIDGMECIRVINWYDPQNKVTCSLSALGIDLDGLDTAVFAENFIKLQADAK